MEKNYIDDTFLARWIAGELSPEELEVFKNSKEYPEFKKINDVAQALEAPPFNQQASFNKIEDLISNGNKETKVVKLMPRWIYSVAAAVVVAFGIFFFMNNNSSNFQTGFGEQQIVTLPDNSKVHLNANSSLSFKKKDWKNSRILSFEGEAFFDVEKGSTFKVITNQGIVEVLGTEFNVVTRDNFFEVQCHEGKVRVSNNSSKTLVTLTKGKAFRLVDNNEENWIFKQEKPAWLAGESSFINAPIKQVITALENQYRITFNTENIDVNRRFTGSFTHKDLNLALKTVFVPMNILYSQKGKTIHLKGKN